MRLHTPAHPGARPRRVSFTASALPRRARAALRRLEVVRRKGKEWFFKNADLTTEKDIRKVKPPRQPAHAPAPALVCPAPVFSGARPRGASQLTRHVPQLIAPVPHRPSAWGAGISTTS